jgi:hypothetical protein
VKVLAHLVAAQCLACSHSNGVLATQWSSGTLGGSHNLVQLFLSNCQQFLALARSFGCQQWIAARNQALSRITRILDLGQIAFIEQR